MVPDGDLRPFEGSSSKRRAYRDIRLGAAGAAHQGAAFHQTGQAEESSGNDSVRRVPPAFPLSVAAQRRVGSVPIQNF
jgi:hypothetical protein